MRKFKYTQFSLELQKRLKEECWFVPEQPKSIEWWMDWLRIFDILDNHYKEQLFVLLMSNDE